MGVRIASICLRKTPAPSARPTRDEALRKKNKIGFLDENTRAIFGRSYAAEPDILIEQLRKTRRSRRPTRYC
jgi:hypothetical protein